MAALLARPATHHSHCNDVCWLQHTKEAKKAARARKNSKANVASRRAQQAAIARAAKVLHAWLDSFVASLITWTGKGTVPAQ